MKKNEQIKNLSIVTAILLIAIAIVSWFDQVRKEIDIGFPLENITLELNGWEGTNMSVSEKEAGWIEKGDLIVRNYKKDDKTVYMVAIQERGDRHKVHSPADCYSGSGWVVLKKDSVKLISDRTKTVRRMHVVKDNVPRIVYYWFSNGEEQCASFKGHLAVFLKDVLLKGTVKSWVCFQISADIREGREVTEKILNDFILTFGV